MAFRFFPKLSCPFPDPDDSASQICRKSPSGNLDIVKTDEAFPHKDVTASAVQATPRRRLPVTAGGERAARNQNILSNLQKTKKRGAVGVNR